MTNDLTQDRLHRALEGLRQFRRRQYAERTLWLNPFRDTLLLTGALTLFLGCGFHAFFPCDSDIVIALAFIQIIAGLLLPLSNPIAWHVGTLLLLVLRIPTVLFFETRMHLLELILIVALLGNGIGFLVAQTGEAMVAATVVLCIVWCVIVLGGAAWGLWVATELKTEDTCERCALILGGVLMSWAILGLVVGPVSLLSGLTAPFSVESLEGIFFGLGTTLASFCLFWIVRGYHARASSAFHLRDLQQNRIEIRERSLLRIRRNTRRRFMEQHHG
jgi:hypothetical protein